MLNLLAFLLVLALAGTRLFFPQKVHRVDFSIISAWSVALVFMIPLFAGAFSEGRTPSGNTYGIMAWTSFFLGVGMIFFYFSLHQPEEESKGRDQK